MTHLLPGGRVPRVHGARNPVPPRPPGFCHSPVSASLSWSLTWFVALCATTALAGAVPWWCVRGARGRSGGSGPVPVLASPLGLLPALASLVVRVAGCHARVSLPFACRYAIPFGLCVPQARSGCPSALRCVSAARLCARAPVAYAPPPGSVWRAPYAPSRCRAPVEPFQTVPAPPRFLPRSRPPPLELLGGGPVPSSPSLALPCAPARGRACASGAVRRVGGGGGGRPSACHPPLGAWLGRGRSGDPRGWGAGSCHASVRPSASPERAPRRASSASLSPWRMSSPYCSGSCPCAPVGQLAGRLAGRLAPRLAEVNVGAGG